MFLFDFIPALYADDHVLDQVLRPDWSLRKVFGMTYFHWKVAGMYI